ncbi:MAG TPA: fatty acid--CoA ligase family protein, partial [Candidatus Ozemobacteraceae bacterium]|nr:fatty acid--CoA ligase family protein [Candidatus Ozemobacteraceae bacterium]
MIIYTSGTTGKPKGVMLTHKAVCAAVRIGIQVGNLQAGDTMLVLLPLTHVFGLVDSGLCPLAVGARVVMSNSFSPPDIMAAVQRYRVNYINAVPRLAEVLLAVMPPSPAIQALGIKMFIGGAACRPEVIKGLQDRGIKAVQGFGMTETAGGIIASTLSSPADSVGKPGAEVQIRIDAPAGQVGEILIKSPTNTSGVFGKPEMYDELYHDGFLRTGDLGEFDKDGNLKIRGRLKDLIIPPGGMNVYPDELELRLGRLPFAEEFAVIGFHEGGHEYPALVVRPNLKEFAGQAMGSVLEIVQQKVQTLIENWPEWEKFRRVICVEAPLPRSPSMKIQRNVLMQAVGAATPGSDRLPDKAVANGA